MKRLKWIELIRVRSSFEILQEVLPKLQNLINDIQNGSNEAEIFFMQHGLYDGDCAAVIVWCNNLAPQKSREGLIIAEKMLELGSIDHAVWIPVLQCKQEKL